MGESASYSIPDLLQTLTREHGERLELRVGLPPLSIIKREDYEVEGRPLTDDSAEAFLCSVADSRHIRDFRERGETEFFFEFQQSQFLVRAKKEHGNTRLDFNLVTD